MRYLLFLLLALPALARAADQPNIVWILSEDNSKHYLRLYGAPEGAAPNIEKLAQQGVTFNHAFSCAPVCSVARTTLMTGIYAPRGGFQYHRKSQLANLPEGLRMWPYYLRQAGYYATNRAKKDYNVVEGKGVWDESSRKASWRNRPDPKTPFFHMETTGVSHESSLHFPPKTMTAEKTTTPLEKIQLPPYFPDTLTFRYTQARYYDRIRAADDHVGRIVKQLEADGVLEDTFIFYFGDHGGVLPRSKGYVYESGLHVPLVVRIPERWKHLAQPARGSRVDGFVQFIDFGPTVMNLTGVKIPKQLDGRPFLGESVSLEALESRQETFGYADRFDEKYDLCRSLRQGRYKYIRNYQGFYPDGLQNNYRYKMLAYEQWRTLYRQGKLNETQSQFLRRRPPEQLFDLEKDPHEVNNLADDPQHRKTLLRLRGRLQQHLKKTNDLSFYPESHMVEHALRDGIAYGEKHSQEIARLIDTADLCLQPFADAKVALQEALASKNPHRRYWALIACSSFAKQAKSLVPIARPRLEDSDLLVRMRAAEFLGLLGAEDPRPALYKALAETESAQEALLMLNAVVLFHDGEPAYSFYPFEVKKLKMKVKMGEVDRRLEYLKSVQ